MLKQHKAVKITRIRVLALLLITLFLAGCSSTFTYNRLDWLIPWYVESYVDLSKDQRKSLRDQITPLLEWHRQEELASYVRFVDQLETELYSDVSSAQVEDWLNAMLQAAERVESSMLPVALEFGASMSDEQMTEFILSLNEQQEEYVEEYLPRSDREYVEDNHDTLIELLKRFIGRLDKSQKNRLLVAAERMERFDTIWLEERAQWLGTLEDILQRKPGWQQSLRNAYMQREANRSAAFNSALEHNVSVISAGVAEVLNSRSAGQQQRTVRELNDIREMLRKLMEKDG